MGIFDFLLGKPQQTVMDARSQQARDFILNELDKVYAQGPINVPKYFAQVPEAAYSGTNNLLSSLGLDTVSPPNMGNNMANIGGMDVYTSDLLQKQMEQDFASRNPSLYNELMGNVDAPTASFTPTATNTATSSGQDYGGGGSSGNRVADFLDPNNRMGMAEHLERQKKNYAEGVSDGAIGFAQTPDGGIYAVGYKPGQMSPFEAAERGFVMRDKNPFEMSLGEHFGQMGSDVVDIAKTVANDVKDLSLIGNLVSKMTGGNDSKQSSFHDDMVKKAQERAKEKTKGLTKTEKRGGAELDSRFGISGL